MSGAASREDDALIDAIEIAVIAKPSICAASPLASTVARAASAGGNCSTTACGRDQGGVAGHHRSERGGQPGHQGRRSNEWPCRTPQGAEAFCIIRACLATLRKQRRALRRLGSRL